MERIRAVFKNPYGCGADLKDMDKLSEFEGEITSCESDRRLIMKIGGIKKEIWGEESMPVKVGDILRGFHTGRCDNAIVLDAYELLNKDGRVLRRGKLGTNIHYSF